MAPRMKKQPTNSSTHDSEEKMKKTTFFKQRFPGFKKKAIELSVLCGNSVGFICYGPDNDSLHVWPENPQTLEKIVAGFDGQSDLKRKRNGCDLRDFPRFDGLSVEELMTHLSELDSHLVGVKQQKLEILTKTIKASTKKEIIRVRTSTPKSKLDLEESKDHLMVSEQRLDAKLGFGGVFDELGYVVRGSDFKPETLVVPKDDGGIGMEAQGYTPLGFESQLNPIADTYDDLPMGIWDLDFFSSTLADSFMSNTCQSSITDNWGNVLQGFQTQPTFMWEPLL